MDEQLKEEIKKEQEILERHLFLQDCKHQTWSYADGINLCEQDMVLNYLQRVLIPATSKTTLHLSYYGFSVIIITKDGAPKNRSTSKMLVNKTTGDIQQVHYPIYLLHSLNFDLKFPSLT